MLQTKAITYILEMYTHFLNVQIVINSKNNYNPNGTL